MATHIGSVFLGDFQRLRQLSSSSTPPSSPPGSAVSAVYSGIPHSPPANSSDQMSKSKVLEGGPTGSSSRLVIDPALALELRLRWLEAIVLGVKQDEKGRKGKDKETLKHGETIMKLAEHIQQRLDAVVEENEALRKFMEHCNLLVPDDQNAHLLTPAFALSGALPEPPTYENMSSEELESFLAEMEPDIRAADRDMQEIDALVKKGTTEVGKLADYEDLQPRLDALVTAHEEDLELTASLEKRVSALMERNATYVDALSELFVAWDDTITEAEDRGSRLERQRDELSRMGLR